MKRYVAIRKIGFKYQHYRKIINHGFEMIAIAHKGELSAFAYWREIIMSRAKAKAAKGLSAHKNGRQCKNTALLSIACLQKKNREIDLFRLRK